MKLSIITVNYNDAKGLERTILSVISQTKHNFEFIVIDGGSTDGSIDVIKLMEVQQMEASMSSINTNVISTTGYQNPTAVFTKA